MGRSSAGFTIRSMMVAVALVALNLAGALATWNTYPSAPGPGRPRSYPRFGDGVDLDADGNARFELGKFVTGHRLVGIVKQPRPDLSLVEIWSPVIAGVSVTLLVVLLGGQTSVRGSTAGGGPRTRLSSAWRKARWMMIAIALIALNVACIVYRPILEHAELQPFSGNSYRPGNFLDTLNKRLLYRGAGGIIITKASDGSERPATLDDYPLPLHRGDENTRVLATIVCGSDGGIVAYEGNPGFVRQILTRPRVIERPTKSRLEMWSPVLAGSSITLVAFYFLWRNARQLTVNPVD